MKNSLAIIFDVINSIWITTTTTSQLRKKNLYQDALKWIQSNKMNAKILTKSDVCHIEVEHPNIPHHLVSRTWMRGSVHCPLRSAFFVTHSSNRLVNLQSRKPYHEIRVNGCDAPSIHPSDQTSQQIAGPWTGKHGRIKWPKHKTSRAWIRHCNDEHTLSITYIGKEPRSEIK